MRNQPPKTGKRSKWFLREFTIRVLGALAAVVLVALGFHLSSRLVPGLEPVIPREQGGCPIWRRSSPNLSDIAFSPDGRTMAVAGLGVSLRDAETGQGLWCIDTGNTYKVNQIAFSPDSRLLAVSVGMSETVQLWRVGDGGLVRELRGHREAIAGLDFSPDGRVLATLSVEGMVRLWFLGEGGEPVPGVLQETAARAQSISFSPDGRFLAVFYGYDLELWRTADWQVERALHLSDYWSGEIAVLPDGQAVALWGIDGLRVVRLSDGAALYEWLEPGIGIVNDVAFSPDGQTMAALGLSWEGYYEATFYSLRLVRVSDWTLLKRFNGGGWKDGLAYSPDGRTLAVGWGDRVRLIDMQSIEGK